MRFLQTLWSIPPAIVLIVAMASVGSAATLVDFDFSGLPGDDFGPLTATNSIDPGVILVNGVESTGGHDIGGGGVETGQFNWAGWIGGDDRDYMKVVLQATTPGAAIAVTSMDISALRNGAGAPMEWYVWVVDGDFTDTGTNLDTADALDMVEITNDRNVDPTFDPFTFDLSGGVAKMGTFSIVMGAEQGGAGSGGVGNLRFNDLVINGPGESRVPSLVIDRQTGAMTLDNPAGGEPLALLGYSITSEFGALDQSDWVTIAGNYDAAGDGSIDPDDAWTILTASGSSGDLSEAELVGGDGGAIAPGTQLDFGEVWLPAPTEDVRIELLSQTGAQVRMGVQYTGDPIANGDLNADGAIDVNDWVAFLVGLNDDVPGISPAAAYQRGDLVNNDLVTDHADFLEFQQLYDAANGAGSFAAMVASVPEPTSGCMMMIGIFVVGLGFVRRRVSRPARRMSVLLILATGLGISLAAAQQATAASVEWGNLFEIFSDADIDTSGEILAAVNGGPAGADDIQVTIGDTVLNFVSPTPSVLPTANAAAGVPATGNLDLDAVFGSQTLTTTAEPLGLFTLSDLSPGQDYQVQIVAGADSRDCCSARTQFFQDTEDGSGNNSDLLAKATDLTASGTLRANSVIGTFTADADTQDLWINGEINPAMTAYVVSAIGNIPRLTLEVNTATGATAIKNDGVDSVATNFYEIRSASGALDPDGWDSLDAQGIDATDGDDPGSVAGDSPLEGWDEATTNTAHVLTEAFLLGQSTFSTGDRQGIGNAYDRQASAEDLVFKFGMTSGVFREGTIEYVNIPDPVLRGDVNLDTVVNGLDVDPFVDVLLNGPFQAEADMNLDEVVNGLDVDPFVAAVVGGGVRAVPEPSTLALVALAGLAMVLRISKGGRLMKHFSFMSIVTAGLLVALIGTTAQADSTNDRSYLFGDNTGVPAQNENATAGQKIGSGAGGVTFDTVSDTNNPASDIDAQNLTPTGASGPKYIGVGTGPFRRTSADGDPNPPAAGDLGAQFNGTGEYLRGARLGLPETAAGSLGNGLGNPNDYNGISNRGYQLWVYPTSNAAAQSVVMDTNQHGVRVSADGNWSMRYNGNDVDSAMPVVTGQWSHVMLVRPFGAAGGSQLYVDGVVAAATGGNYNGDDNASLVLGSNTGRDADGNFTGGTEEFFSGVMDNLEMFVLGTNTSDPSTDYGAFDAQVDNAFIAGALKGLPDGDVNMNGVLEPVADVDAFVAGWLNVNDVNGIRAGDLGSRAAGDLNFDGITDLSDAFLLHEALSAAGGGLDFSVLTTAVPEPSTLVLLSLAALIGLAWRRR
jgi:hypothetical protein